MGHAIGSSLWFWVRSSGVCLQRSASWFVYGLWFVLRGLSHLTQCHGVGAAEQKSDKRGFKGVEVERTECESVEGGEGEH